MRIQARLKLVAAQTEVPDGPQKYGSGQLAGIERIIIGNVSRLIGHSAEICRMRRETFFYHLDCF